jgi:CheY-like chemotaxis protein
MSSPAVDKPKPIILVAEDDPVLMRMLTKVLSEVGTILPCADGMDALQYLQAGENLPRLIVTDVMMPRLDGMQLVARLRSEPRLAAIPVIMLTAKGTPRDIIQGINSGVRHYITKPFKQDDLLSKVKKTLG